MFKIFRKVRQSLINENRFTKYLIYAVGEIILVVIGILLALQVNNWNESKKTRAQESKLLENLKSEFESNQLILADISSNNKKIYSSTKALLDLIGADNATIDSYNTDSLLYNAILIHDFQPNQFVLSRLKTGDNLDIIRSDELKMLLYEWDKEISLKSEAFNMLNTYFMNSLITFLDENASLANIDTYGNSKWSRPTRLDEDHAKIFGMILFENRLENHIWCVNSFDSAITRLTELSKQIINEINSLSD